MQFIHEYPFMTGMLAMPPFTVYNIPDSTADSVSYTSDLSDSAFRTLTIRPCSFIACIGALVLASSSRKVM